MVHHALMQVVEPIFERSFIHDSYACRRGKGTHRAAARFERYLRASRFVLQLDVKKFFPSLDHQVLLGLLATRLHDEGARWLFRVIVDGSNPQEEVYDLFPGDDLFTPLHRRKGIPIGNLTSQFLGNLALDPVDHLVKDRLRCRRYVRYADDMALFSDSKAELHTWKAEVEAALARLRLKLHPTKQRVHRADEGVSFVGFRFTPAGRRLARRSVVRAGRRFRGLSRAWAAGRVTGEHVAASLEAWLAHAAWARTRALRGSLVPHLVLARAGELSRAPV